MDLKSLALNVFETVDFFGEGIAISHRQWCLRFDRGNLTSTRRRWENLKRRLGVSPFDFEIVHDLDDPYGQAKSLIFGRGTRDKAQGILDSGTTRICDTEQEAREVAERLALLKLEGEKALQSWRGTKTPERVRKAGRLALDTLEDTARKLYNHFGVTGVTPEEICEQAGLPASDLNMSLVQAALITMSLEDSA